MTQTRQAAKSTRLGRKATFKRPTRRPSSNGRPAPTLNGRTASFIWAFWGDDDLTTMGQETMRLKKAMDGYDYKVLMKHQHTPPWLDLSEGDERRADVMVPPTPENFTRELVSLAQAGYCIDIYINSHGSNDNFLASGGSHNATPERITAALIRDLPQQAGFSKLPIRAVFQTQCYAASLNPAWRQAGAKVSGGPRHVNFYPNGFGNFVGDWNRGKTYSQSVVGADGPGVRTLAQAYILGDASARRSDGSFGGCSFGNTVLGKRSCAEEYFVPRWLAADEWQDHLSGKQNMNYSSSPIISGNRNIRKTSDSLTW